MRFIYELLKKIHGNTPDFVPKIPCFLVRSPFSVSHWSESVFRRKIRGFIAIARSYYGTFWMFKYPTKLALSLQ